jgi:transcriptional regulator with XRE-family HTH domain
MDTIKIGNFLAELRKEQNLTQEALGEKLGVTNKTVSRWENGNYLPPVEMLQELSKLYAVSINEILCGERIAEENYQAKAEETIAGILTDSSFSLKERTDFWRRKWLKDHLLTNIVLSVLLIIMVIVGISISSPLIIGSAPFLAVVTYMIRRNDMMIYVENNLYGPIK